MDKIESLFHILTRKKHYNEETLNESKLRRCLSLFEVTTLGIGSTVGLGMYVLGGQVAATKAGPGVVVAYLIAAITSLFAALCYAEFGARVPRAGSAYIYSYVTVGELMAFFIGWDLVLEYVIGAASIARGYSGYLDALLGGHVERFVKDHLPIHFRWLGDYPDIYPDLLAFGIVFALTIMLALGVRESTRFHAVFTVLNLCVVVFIVVVGGMHADIDNWRLGTDGTDVSKNITIPTNAGHGGFLPFGFQGLMSGAATCFYAFVGFDVIATMGEEVKNPRTSIPISICVSLLVVVLVYTSVAAVQTLTWPYWDQNKAAPISFIFDQLNLPMAKWVVVIGALFGLSSALLGALFPLPRILYAMGADGLIFRFFAQIHPRFQTPLIATFISGTFAASMAALFDVSELADMMSIGTLNAYSLVSLSVLILRYHEDFDEFGNVKVQTISQLFERETTPKSNQESFTVFSPTDSISLRRNRTISPPLSTPDIIEEEYRRVRGPSLSKRRKIALREVQRTIFNQDRLVTPTQLTVAMSKWIIAITTAFIIALDFVLIFCANNLYNLDSSALIAVAILIVLIIIGSIAISRQPKADRFLSFKVPFVPLVPLLSIMSNMYLALSLSSITWIRFIIWFLVGMVIYFTYGIWNSSEHLRIKLLVKKKVSEVELQENLVMAMTIPRLNIIEATPQATVKVY